MSEWNSVDDKMPSQPTADIVYDSKPYIVTDGFTVGTCDFQRGNGCGKLWAEWSPYGEVERDKITHWMPLPEPPQ